MSDSQEPRKSTLRTAGFGAIIGLAVAATIAALSLTPIGVLFEKWELALLDNRLIVSRHPERVTDDLVVITIDDRAIRKLEIDQQLSWPYPRWFYGELVAALEKLEPAAIVFDFVFADQRDGVRYGTDTNPFAAPVEGDAATLVEYSRGTGQQMNHAGNVVHGFFAMSLEREELEEDGKPKNPAAREQEIRNLSGWNKHLTGYFDARIPTATGSAAIPRFKEKEPGQVQVLRFPEANLLVGARALGLVNHEHVTDIDGNSRVFLPLVSVGGRPTADLASTAILVAQLPKTESPAWTDAQPPAPSAWPVLPPIRYDRKEIAIGKWTIPVDDRGLGYIRWRGNWEQDKNLSRRTRNVLDVWLERDNLLLGEPTTRIQKEDIKGKIVLVGFTGQGEGADFVNTPFGNQPGVFRHAAIIDTILTQDFPRGLPTAADWILAFSLAGATGALILARAQKTTRLSQMGTGFQVVRLLLIGFVPVVAFIAVAYAVFMMGGQGGGYDAHIVTMVPAILGMALTIPSVVVVGIAWTQADERRARKIAVRALGPALVKQVLSGGGELKMGGTKVPLTLFFSDIAGFTTISEKLSPEELINMLNEYLTRVSEILHDGHGATIDKYIGDAVMAFWGAPIPQEDAPVRACMAAIDVMKAIDQFSSELVAQGLSPLKTRIGLNTGFAVAGGVGHIRDLEDGKFTYTAMGDTVNLASRLEGANKAYGTTCMIGPDTYEQAKHAILVRELDLVRVKGKTIPVRVYELMGKASEELPEKRIIKERYEKALVHFRSRQFEAAKTEFAALIAEYKDPPSKTLAAACDEMMKNPPPADWDGSNELHEK